MTYILSLYFLGVIPTISGVHMWLCCCHMNSFDITAINDCLSKIPKFSEGRKTLGKEVPNTKSINCSIYLLLLLTVINWSYLLSKGLVPFTGFTCG